MKKPLPARINVQHIDVIMQYAASHGMSQNAAVNWFVAEGIAALRRNMLQSPVVEAAKVLHNAAPTKITKVIPDEEPPVISDKLQSVLDWWPDDSA